MRIFKFATFAIGILSSLMADAERADEFSYENEDFDGVRLNYRMSVINPEIQTPETIVIYLHSGSSRGDDNESQLQTQAAGDIYDYLKDNGYHARMIAPQAPDGHQWEDELLPAIKALSDKYKISEESEIFILGGSMGGYGVWNILTAYPDYFSGAMPVACNQPRNQVENYTGTKIYSVVGGMDPNRNLNAIQSFFNRLEGVTEKGSKLDIEPEWDHRETCEWSFTPKRLKWLFDECKSSINDVITDSSVTSSCIFDLNGNLVNNLQSGRIYIFGGKKVLYPSL